MRGNQRIGPSNLNPVRTGLSRSIALELFLIRLISRRDQVKSSMDTQCYLLAHRLALLMAVVICQRVQAEDNFGAPAEAQVERLVVQPVVFREVMGFAIARVISPAHPIDALVYDTDKESGHQQVELMLGHKVDELSTEYGLTEAQEAKLKLAAKTETRRFHYEVDEIRRQFAAAQDQQNVIQTLTSEAHSLRKKRFALFGTDSLFAKVARRMVTDEQVAKREAALSERSRLRHRSNIEGAIRNIELHVVLQIPQHEALVEFMIKEIPPPREETEYDGAVVGYQLARLPESQVKAIFTEDQWIVVRKCLHDFDQMGTHLATEGKIPFVLRRFKKANQDTSNEVSPADATRPESQSVAGGL